MRHEASEDEEDVSLVQPEIIPGRSARSSWRSRRSAGNCFAFLSLSLLIGCGWHYLAAQPVMISGCYYTNLASDTKRNAHMQVWLGTEQQTCKRLEAVRAVMPSKSERVRRGSNPATLACRLSHVEAMRRIANLDASGRDADAFFLVLEDDLGGSLQEALRQLSLLVAIVPWQLHLVNLAPRPLGENLPSHLVEPSFALPAVPWYLMRTTAYAITPRGARRMLEYLGANELPIDVDQASNTHREAIHSVLTLPVCHVLPLTQAMLKASRREFSLLLRAWSLPKTGLGELEDSQSTRKSLNREAAGKGDIDD